MRCNSEKSPMGRPVRVAFQEPKLKAKDPVLSGSTAEAKLPAKTVALEDKPHRCNTSTSTWLA